MIDGKSLRVNKPQPRGTSGGGGGGGGGGAGEGGGGGGGDGTRVLRTVYLPNEQVGSTVTDSNRQ